MMADKPLKAKVKGYEARNARWDREREDYIREHGLAAWDRKIDREIKVLYPEEGQL